MFDRQFVILELANLQARPIASMYFAELGARVIKIENPHTRGDATRAWRPLNEDPTHDVSSYFSCANWGKESIALDTTTAAGLAITPDLCARADIVTTSFKPGDALLARIRARTAQLTSAELAAALSRAKVPYGDVNDRAAVFGQAAAQALVMTGRANGLALRGVHSCAFSGDAATIVTPSPPPRCTSMPDRCCGTSWATAQTRSQTSRPPALSAPWAFRSGRLKCAGACGRSAQWSDRQFAIAAIGDDDDGQVVPDPRQRTPQREPMP